MKTVLIVDDAMFMRYTIKQMLENSDFNVIGEADNGINALIQYQELRPDLVTMDITMPEVNGIGAVQLIKKFDPKAKILMMSAMGQETMVKEAIIAGAQGFLVKPFKQEDVINALNRL
ncbi:MAG TPA: response regulator [Syntrophomonadaceae bacterium]|nr:response regulator [Syntrophomonadaceae bacterium]